MLEQILAHCDSLDMEPIACTALPVSAGERKEVAGGDVLAMYDDNGNGRITCKEARRHGIAPVRSDHPAFRYMKDDDGTAWSASEQCLSTINWQAATPPADSSETSQPVDRAKA